MYDLLPKLKVAEISDSVGARYAARLLADLGARVHRIKIEGVEDLAESPASLDVYLDANKHVSTVGAVDIDDPKIARAVCNVADIVLFDGRNPYFRRHLLEGKQFEDTPTALCIVSPWGIESPYADLCDDELLVFSVSGTASVTPEGAADRNTERPTYPWGRQGSFAAGIAAALAALQAWLSVAKDGKSRLVDLATLDVVSCLPITAVAGTSAGESPPPAPAERPATVPRGMLRCRDGYVYTQGGDDNWNAWANLLGRDEWTKPPFDDPSYRLSVREQFEPVIAEWLLQHTTYEVYEASQAAGIVVFPVNTISAVLADPQMQYRDAFPEVVDEVGSAVIRGPRTPVRIAEGNRPFEPDRIAKPGAFNGTKLESSPGRSTGATKGLPLEGVRVADFSWVIAGPRCTEWLGAMGAEVIKVESHLRPDRTRGSAPFIDGVASMDGSTSFNMLNYSKKGCTINLGTAEGRRIARQLIARSDIVIENFSGEGARKMGLVFEDLIKENERLVMISCSGLGRNGPGAEARAFGKSIHAFTGHTYLTGWPNTPPRGIGTNWTDPLVGSIAALAAVAGLMHARERGRGVYFDLSMAESTVATLAEAFLFALNEGIEPQPQGNARPGLLIHDVFRCTDGAVAVSAHSDDETNALRNLIVGTQIIDDEGLLKSLSDWCGSRDRESALTALRNGGVCAAPLNSLAQMLADPHFAHREMILKLRATHDRPGIPAFGLPWRQTPEAPFVYYPSPELGQDNDYVFKEVLGFSDEQIVRLTESTALI